MTSTARKINGERIVVLGWGRAILLQVAHPLVAAGVSDHSSFTSNRFARVGRLHATVRAMLELTFGNEQAVARTAAHINGIHDRVNGVLGEPAGPYAAGTRYTAHDPLLLRWVHATLLDSVPLAYERFVGPLTAAEKDAYCLESTSVARLLGVPDPLVPSTRVALDACMDEMLSGPHLHVTAAARQIAHDLLYPPLLDPSRPAAWLVRLVTLGLLPAHIRAAYGFRWTPAREHALGLACRLLRAVRPIVPGILARWPQARDTDLAPTRAFHL